jgi:hypothetical protein
MDLARLSRQNPQPKGVKGKVLMNKDLQWLSLIRHALLPCCQSTVFNEIMDLAFSSAAKSSSQKA